MKKFLFLLFLFILPLLVLFALLEKKVREVPTSYSLKYHQVVTHGKDYEIVAVGHSQFYDGIYPAAFSRPAFNLSNSAQNYRDDYYILKELLPYMPNLKYIVLPLGFIDAGASFRERDYSFRMRYYHLYMHLDYDHRLPLFYWYECFDPKNAFEKYKAYYMRHEDLVQCDSSGISSKTLDNHVSFKGLDLILSYNNDSPDGSDDYDIIDKSYLLGMCELLEDKNIQLVFVASPFYKDCFQYLNKKQQDYFEQFADTFCRNHGYWYLNLHADTITYDKSNYGNESHLNLSGAMKFSKAIDDFILSKENERE